MNRWLSSTRGDCVTAVTISAQDSSLGVALTPAPRANIAVHDDVFAASKHDKVRQMERRISACGAGAAEGSRGKWREGRLHVRRMVGK